MFRGLGVKVEDEITEFCEGFLRLDDEFGRLLFQEAARTEGEVEIWFCEVSRGVGVGDGCPTLPYHF